MSEKIKYKFFYKTFYYEGYIEEKTDSHFIIKDIKKNKIIHLPKSETSMEEIKIDNAN